MQITVTAIDELGVERQITCEETDQHRHLYDSNLNIHTHDLCFRCWRLNDLPGSYASNPPEPWSQAAISAHANAAQVAGFIKTVLGRNGWDGTGGRYISSINVLDSYIFDGQATHPHELLNAYWLPAHQQVVFGQKIFNHRLYSFASSISIVAHEFFHGINHYTARLEGRSQSGVLNESYADIFAILMTNFHLPNIRDWSWEIGEPFPHYGFPIRNIRYPELYNHANHMDQYSESRDEIGDFYYNAGIQNRAAYHIITAKDQAGNYLFDAKSLAKVFYRALLTLRSDADLNESREKILMSAASEFRNDAKRLLQQEKIVEAFAAVGIPVS